MYKKILIACACFFMCMAGTAMACGGGDCGNSTPAATANAGAQSSASIHVTPVTNNTSGSNSAAQSNVGINNNPTNTNLAGGGTALAGGGTGVGIGGSSTAVAANGDQVMVLDMSHQKTYNRQHIMPYGVAAPPAAQMFDAWGKMSWNISPISPEKLKAGEVNTEVDTVHERLRIYRKLPATDSVVLRGYLTDKIGMKAVYLPPTGRKVGDMEVVLAEEYTVRDALNYACAIAMKNGADQVEVVQYAGRKKPTVDGWSVGFGSSASGLIGDAEKAAVSGGGGTNISSSSIVKEDEPWISVIFWKNGSANKPAIVTGYTGMTNSMPTIKPTAVKAVAGEGD